MNSHCWTYRGRTSLWSFHRLLRFSYRVNNLLRRSSLSSFCKVWFEILWDNSLLGCSLLEMVIVLTKILRLLVRAVALHCHFLRASVVWATSGWQVGFAKLATCLNGGVHLITTRRSFNSTLYSWLESTRWKLLFVHHSIQILKFCPSWLRLKLRFRMMEHWAFFHLWRLVSSWSGIVSYSLPLRPSSDWWWLSLFRP